MLSDPTQDPVIGSLLDGRYQVSKLLGQGGMGNVYLAEETRLRRRCALKVLHPKLAQERTHVERFLREAQTIAQLEHSNIVDIYAYGEEPSGIVWFAMELLIGEDLDSRLKARAERPFTTHDCCAWGIQIAQAVTVVHDAGLIHRDLKTSNVFLAQRRDGEELVKLLDFGIARPEEGSELTATGVALGTPSYMSPEQVKNTIVDRRSDVYSFGVLLFKLLTKRLPFLGEPIQVAMAQCTVPAPVPSIIAPEAGISPELDALVLRTLAKDPSERYQSMRELEKSLLEILYAEAPDFAPPVKPPRMATTSQISLRPDLQPAALIMTVASTSPETSTSDTATASSMTPATGPTTAFPTQRRARTDRWLVITTCVSTLSVVLFLAVTMFIRKGDHLSPASATVPTAASVVLLPASLEPPVAPPMGPLGPSATSVAAPPLLEPLIAPDKLPAALPPATALPSGNKVAVKAPFPVTPKAKSPAARLDPLAQIERKALSCRRKHGKVDGPKLTIDYAVGIDGKVTRSIPPTADELGKCLAGAVAATQFESKVALGKKIAL